MRKRTLGLLMVALGSCTTPAPPDLSSLTYRVTVPASREIALVAPSAQLATISGLEDAARRETGCRATAIPRIYDAVDQDRDAAVPAALYSGFGGQLPVTLACR